MLTLFQSEYELLHHTIYFCIYEQMYVYPTLARSRKRKRDAREREASRQSTRLATNDRQWYPRESSRKIETLIIF